MVHFRGIDLYNCAEVTFRKAAIEKAVLPLPNPPQLGEEALQEASITEGRPLSCCRSLPIMGRLGGALSLPKGGVKTALSRVTLVNLFSHEMNHARISIANVRTKEGSVPPNNRIFS